LGRRELAELGTALALVLFGAWLGGMGTGIWLSYELGPRTLWEDTVMKSPNKFRPRINLSAEYEKRGNYAGALLHAQRAIQIDPFKPEGYINAHTAALRLKSPELAFQYGKEVLKRKNLRIILDNQIFLAELLGLKEEQKRLEELSINFKEDSTRWKHVPSKKVQ
jgi:tetratricopeptide (TPR) repeat protein